MARSGKSRIRDENPGESTVPVPESMAIGSPRIAPLRPMVGFLALALLAGLVGLSEHSLVYGTLILFLCVVGIPVWLHWHQGRLDPFESIHVIGFINLVYFGFGALWTVGDPQNIAFDLYTVPYIPRAALFCLLGQAAMAAAYFGPWYRQRSRVGYEEWPHGLGFLVVASGLGIIGSVARGVWSYAHWADLKLNTLIASVGQLAPIYYVAWGMGWIMVFSGRATRAQRRFVQFIQLPVTVGIILISLTDKSLALTLAGIPLVAYWYAKRKLPWRRLGGLLVILVFVIFPFINTFRNIDARLPMSSRLELTFEIIGAWTTEEYLRNSVDAVKGRVALINCVAVVIRDVPRWVPYAQGDTIFLPALEYSTPRILWPDKPVFSMGREFGETFRMVGILDEKTNISTTVPGELFWNFDLPGVLIGMAFWGWGAAVDLSPIRRGRGRRSGPACDPHPAAGPVRSFRGRDRGSGHKSAANDPGDRGFSLDGPPIRPVDLRADPGRFWWKGSTGPDPVTRARGALWYGSGKFVY